MIKLTDMTISCLEKYNPSKEQLIELIDLLISAGADFIEIPVSALLKIGELNPFGKYVLRIDSPGEADKYSGFGRYVCKKNGFASKGNVITEIQANDIREINLLSQYGKLENVRIVGFDDILNHDYISAFSNLKSKVSGKIELCPENKYFCATSIAVEWILFGEQEVVVSFAGINSKAAFEEVMMALRFEKRHKPRISSSIFPQISELIEKITSVKLSKRHNMCEHFCPEQIGNEQKILIGNSSVKH